MCDLRKQQEKQLQLQQQQQCHHHQQSFILSAYLSIYLKMVRTRPAYKFIVVIVGFILPATGYMLR